MGSGIVSGPAIMFHKTMVLIAFDQTPANVINAGWTDLYSVSLSTAQTDYDTIIITAQIGLDTSNVSGAPSLRVVKDSTQIGPENTCYTSLPGSVLPSTCTGQTLIGILKAGTDYTRKTAFNLKIQGQAPAADHAYYYSSFVSGITD